MDIQSERGRGAGSGLLGKGSNWALGFAVVLGLALRLWWIWHFGQTTNDTRIYGEFARNLLEHHVYGYTNLVNGVSVMPTPTMIRLPGYPLFLAVCFRVFGMENYTAVMIVQAAVDVWTCLLVAGTAARMFGRRAGVAALWLAAVCPFTANYVSAPLTETLTLFCIGLGFYGLVRWRESAGINRWVVVVGFALAYAILLRPEQGLLAAAVVPAMMGIGYKAQGFKGVGPAVLVSVLTLAPLLPWTARNWVVFHRFEPLAPRYATDPGEMINYGFQKWFRTWGVEFTSTDNVYWNYDGAAISIADLPTRAFDSNAQYAETEKLLADYNETDNPSPALDKRFNAIAEERIKADPLRYYLALPVARVTDMIFRPRTEMLPVPLEWWKFKDHKGADAFALAYAGLNLAYFALAGLAFWRRSLWRGERAIVWAMAATILLRIALLLTVDNSEDRYTLEFFPVVFVLAGAWIGAGRGEKVNGRS